MTGRDSFREVLLEGRLRDALRRINLRPRRAAVARRRHASRRRLRLRCGRGRSKLIEINQQLTDGCCWAPRWRVWLAGITAGTGRCTSSTGSTRSATTSWWSTSSGSMSRVARRTSYIVPDLVLFVNGIPLVVVECKSPRRRADGRGDRPAPPLRQPARLGAARGQRAAVPHQPVPGGDLLRAGAGGHVHRRGRALRRVEDHRAGARGRRRSSAW